MSELLYDRILNPLLDGSPLPVGGWAYKGAGPLCNAIVIKADNVYQYLEKNPDIYSIPPKPMPPFKYSFIEFAVSSIEKWGIHTGCFEYETDECKKLTSFLSDNETNQLFKENFKYLILCHVFKLYDDKLWVQKTQLAIFLDSECEFLGFTTFGENIEDQIRIIVTQSYLALFAFSLMNCKNIILINNNPPNSIQKKRIKRGERPLVQYKTIEINGSTSTANKCLKKPKEDPTMSFHIVRGNFAIYDARPLFGKHFGTFWRPQHSKGSKDLGTIVKDYSIGDPSK